MKPRSVKVWLLIWAAITVAVCVALIVAVPRPARAHDDAAWIEIGGYKNPVTNERCCGRSDCERVPADKVLLRGDGKYEIDGYTIPLGQVLSSEDAQWWVCWRGVVIFQQNRTRTIRCLFNPLRG